MKTNVKLYKTTKKRKKKPKNLQRVCPTCESTFIAGHDTSEADDEYCSDYCEGVAAGRAQFAVRLLEAVELLQDLLSDSLEQGGEDEE